MLTYKNSYSVPRWCRMPIEAHFDGMGGCWGVSHGLVEQQGRDYCRLCCFYRKIAERVDPYRAMSETMNSAETQRAKVFRGERVEPDFP